MCVQLCEGWSVWLYMNHHVLKILHGQCNLDWFIGHLRSLVLAPKCCKCVIKHWIWTCKSWIWAGSGRPVPGVGRGRCEGGVEVGRGHFWAEGRRSGRQIRLRRGWDQLWQCGLNHYLRLKLKLASWICACKIIEIDLNGLIGLAGVWYGIKGNPLTLSWTLSQPYLVPNTVQVYTICLFLCKLGLCPKAAFQLIQ